EAVEPALGDLGDRLLGLALLARGGLGDGALLLDDVRGDVLAGQELRAHRGDLHRGAASGVRVVTGVFDQHTDGGRQVGGTTVQVDDRVAVEVGDLAELDLLADGDGEL